MARFLRLIMRTGASASYLVLSLPLNALSPLLCRVGDAS